jgi:hypothetical protein
VLAFGFLPVAGSGQDANQHGVSRNRKGVGSDQISSIRHHFISTAGMKPAYQDVEKRGAGPLCGFSFREEPGLEILLVGNREAFQEFAPKFSSQCEQTFCGEGIGTCGKLPSNFEQIDGGSFRTEEYILPVSNDPFAARFINERTQPA